MSSVSNLPGLRIGVTGSEGLVGSALCGLLEAQGCILRRFDKSLARGSIGHGDVLDAARVHEFAAECDGVVHLAAVSRVVWGERDPWLCERTNVGGTEHVVEAALCALQKPFVVLASSREVYGEPDGLPVVEDAPRRPLNVYGRSKVVAEDIVLAASARGLRTAVLRLSNVYGSTSDHRDRVVPAFARAAARGDDLRLDGPGHTFDFTHVDDSARGIVAAVSLLSASHCAIPPIHLLTGRATSLQQLAEVAVEAAGSRSRLRVAPSRTYDVGRFVGDPTRAANLLGWRAERSVEAGVRELVLAFRAQIDAPALPAARSAR